MPYMPNTGPKNHPQFCAMNLKISHKCSTILVFQPTSSDYPENWIWGNYVTFSKWHHQNGKNVLIYKEILKLRYKRFFFKCSQWKTVIRM